MNKKEKVNFEKREAALGYNLIWIDTEFTGLDFDNAKLLEVAVVITDKDLNILDKGLEIIIHQDDEVLENMDPWCIEHFEESGLTERSRNSKISLENAEKEILKYLEKWTERRQNSICGNSVGHDRRLLFKYMKNFEDKWASYRTIDVSSIKELVKRWKPEILEEVKKIKKENHRAMDDILESIEELKIYRKQFFKE